MVNQLGDAPTKTEEEQSMTSWTPSEKENSKSVYGCDILIENGTWEQVSTKDCPYDAMIITYVVDGETRYDLTRSQKAVNIFDMYYDKFGKGLKNIDYGEGRHNPKLWGLKAPQTKKKK